MLAFTNGDTSNVLLNTFEMIYTSLSKFIDIILIFSPITLFCIFAIQFSDPNQVNLLKSLAKLVILMSFLLFLMMIVSFLIVKHKIKFSFGENIKAVKRTFLV
ncbi:MAG: cation:dicarboxylase symporter family transporter [Oscillospiraceae bacterium]|jgi:Na+/serine symporter|nr:cation:dicarboxylase symporter family transporter [Oscillospiraceae bacterium]